MYIRPVVNLIQTLDNYFCHLNSTRAFSVEIMMYVRLGDMLGRGRERRGRRRTKNKPVDKQGNTQLCVVSGACVSQAR